MPVRGIGIAVCNIVTRVFRRKIVILQYYRYGDRVVPDDYNIMSITKWIYFFFNSSLKSN